MDTQSTEDSLETPRFTPMIWYSALQDIIYRNISDEVRDKHETVNEGLDDRFEIHDQIGFNALSPQVDPIIFGLCSEVLHCEKDRTHDVIEFHEFIDS